jgi:hypothetical protein
MKTSIFPEHHASTQLSITGSAVTYTHNQGSVSNTWVIVHDLGRFPSVTVVDSGGTVVTGNIVYDSNNQITLTFFANGSLVAFSGKAYLN